MNTCHIKLYDKEGLPSKRIHNQVGFSRVLSIKNQESTLPRRSMYAVFAYVGVVPGGSMGRHIFQSHGLYGLDGTPKGPVSSNGET